MNRRKGVICLAALGSFLLCGSTAPPGCQSSGHIGPTTGEVVGAAVGIGAVIAVGTVALIKVHDSHHVIKGCVSSGPDGLEVRNVKDNKTYALTGITANVKAGDIIQVHGSKEKKQKDSAGVQDFKIEKMSRDYGPCTTAAAQSAAAANPAGSQ